MKNNSTLLYFFFITLILFSCNRDSDYIDFLVLDNPAGTSAAQPWIATDSDGVLYLSWIEAYENNEHKFLFSRYENATWTPPEVISIGNNWFVNWADLPGILPLPNGNLIAWYLVRNSASIYGYDILMRIRDPINGWSEPFSPHEDGTPTQHGFVSMTPVHQGILTAWLDGRETELSSHHNHEEEGGMTLRSAITNEQGLITEAHLIDGLVCSCCPTSITKTSDGWLLAYRNRTKDEIRDIYLARFDGQTWSEPYPLYNDGWVMWGCPVNGPSVDAVKDNVVAGWYTAAYDKHSVRVAFSDDGGKTFDNPIIVDESLPVGRVSVSMIDDKRALLSWMGTHKETQTLNKAIIDRNGNMKMLKTLHLQSPAARMAPKMIRSNSTIYSVWVEYDLATSTNKIKIAQLILDMD